MRSKKIPAKEQYRLIMECRQSGLTDHQWCVEHDIKPGTFYNWVKRLRQKGCMDIDIPASTGRSCYAPESQEVVRIDFHDTDMFSCQQPSNTIPASAERNSLSVTDPMCCIHWYQAPLTGSKRHLHRKALGVRYSKPEIKVL